MAEENFTVITKFIPLRLTDWDELKVWLIVLFLVVYTVTLVGNLGMSFIIRITPKLHTPMFFFLSCLSLVDACYSSTIAPKTLINLMVVKGTISFIACIIQHLCFGMFVTTEGFLLSVMAYDLYVAIVNPLLYTVAMSKKTCVGLMIGSWVDTSTNELLLLTFSGVVAMATFLVVIISYVFIVFAILRIRSASRRKKAFSTCVSHLTAVSLVYGTLSLGYIQPSSQYSVEQKVVAVFYTLVIPMLNPMIYSLRNKEVKDAVKRAIERRHFSCKV